MDDVLVVTNHKGWVIDGENKDGWVHATLTHFLAGSDWRSGETYTPDKPKWLSPNTVARHRRVTRSEMWALADGKYETPRDVAPKGKTYAEWKQESEHDTQRQEG